MSGSHDDSHSAGHGVRFEPTDITARPIVLSALGITVITLVYTAIAWFTYQGLAAREQASSAPASPLAAQAPTQPPAPRLQADPKADLIALRARENAELSKYAWIDKARGIAQVPIERAMEMVAAKGLPARKAPVPANMKTKPKTETEAAPAHGAAGGHGH